MLYGRYRYKNEQLHEKHRCDRTVQPELVGRVRAGGGWHILNSHVSVTAVSQSLWLVHHVHSTPSLWHSVHGTHNTYIDSHGWMLMLYKTDNYMCVHIKKEWGTERGKNITIDRSHTGADTQWKRSSTDSYMITNDNVMLVTDRMYTHCV